MSRSFAVRLLNPSLRSRLAVFVVLTCVPMLAIVLYSSFHSRQVDERRAQQEVARLTRLAAADEQEVLNGVRQTVVDLSETDAVRGGEPRVCSALLAAVHGRSRFANLFVAGLDGGLTCSAVPPAGPVSIADRSYFQRTLQTGEFAIGEYQVGRVVNRPVISAGYPIRDNSGNAIGVVGASLDLAGLSTAVGRFDLPPGWTVTLTDRGGTVLVQVPDDGHTVGTHLADAAPVTPRQGLTSTATLAHRPNGDVAIESPVAFGDVPVPDLTVRVSGPEQSLDAQFEHDLRRNLSAAALVTLLGLGAAWVFGERFFVRRVHALLRTADRLAAGDLKARSGLPAGRDELAKLAVSIDHMAGELERRTDEVARRQEHFRALIETGSDVITVIDVEGRLQYVSPSVHRVFGYEPGTVIGRDAFSLVHPDDRERLLQAFQGVASTPGVHRPIEFRVRHADGSWRYAEAVANNLLNHPTVAGIVEVLRDITERRQAEEELAALLHREQEAREAAESSNRAKDEFLALLSHELRTPLTPIIGFVQLLRRDRLDPRLRDYALEMIERNAQSQTRLVSDLLDVSRIVAGKLPLERRSVDLCAAVETAAAAFAGEAREKGIELELTLDPQTGYVDGDTDRLQQIVRNLIANALKFTPAGGRVDVELRRDGAEAILSVSDTGIGIEPAFLPEVFERFRQADASSSRQHGGLGLGLAIVRSLVELHDGTVRAESDGPGRGARFIVTLPLRTAAPVAAEPSVTAPASAPPTLATVRVVVVEDNADTRELIGVTLSSAGAEVTSVASAADAIAAIERTAPDVLVSDIGLPGEDGYALIKRLRGHPRAAVRTLPAIALTAYAGGEDRALALSCGFDEHLPKPVDPARLVALVATFTTAWEGEPAAPIEPVH
jgi:PAS domain S-box-containing protein